MTNLISSIRNSLMEAGISPRKILSQNFLVNSDIINRQIEYAEISLDDVILEIGAGTGELSQRIALKAKHLFCVEYDKQLADYLRKKFANVKNVTVIEGDVLKIGLPNVNKIVANLPYHISSPITFKLLDLGFDIAILMYQYEFARRMVAEPKSDDYSRLSVNVQLQADIKILEKVSKKEFYPSPKVDSAIVRLQMKESPIKDIKYFRIVSRLLFNTKNKLVSSVLYDFFKKKIPAENRLIFKKQLDNDIKLSSKRVRELTIEDLVLITKELLALLEKNDLQNLLPEK